MAKVSAPLRKSEPPAKFLTDPLGRRFEVTPQGLFYCPEEGRKKRHPCPDCHFCQGCSDSRCGLCRRDPKSCPGGKRSSD